MNIEEIGRITEAPRTSKELVFKTPWEARIFAIIAHLATNNRFDWDEFRDCLVDQISQGDPQDGKCDDVLGTPYYRSWLAAAEVLLESIDFCSNDELESRLSQLSDPHAPGRQSPTGDKIEPVSVHEI
jgi:nitrile hydratase accessory protein